MGFYGFVADKKVKIMPLHIPQKNKKPYTSTPALRIIRLHTGQKPEQPETLRPDLFFQTKPVFLYHDVFIRENKISFRKKNFAWIAGQKRIKGAHRRVPNGHIISVNYVASQLTFSFKSGKLRVYWSGCVSEDNMSRAPLRDVTAKVGTMARMTRNEVRILAAWARQYGWPLGDVKHWEESVEPWKIYNDDDDKFVTKNNVSETVRALCYPTLIGTKAIIEPELPSKLLPVLATGRLRDLAKYAFGSHGKNALKAALFCLNEKSAFSSANMHMNYCVTRISTLMAASFYRGLLPPNELETIAIGNKNSALLWTKDGYGDLNHDTKRMLFAQSMVRRRLWITDSDSFYILNDTARLWVLLGEPKINHAVLKEAHEYMSMVQREMVQEDYDIKPAFESFDLFAKDSNNIAEAHYRVSALTSNYESIAWGIEMNNCIAGYAPEAKIGKTTLACVTKNCLKEKSIVACIMVVNKFVIQFYGHHNTLVPGEAHDLVLEGLHTRGLIRDSSKKSSTFRALLQG